MTDAEVAAAFGVPVAALTADTTYANAAAANRAVGDRLLLCADRTVTLAAADIETVDTQADDPERQS